MKVSNLKKMGLIVDITVDFTNIDAPVKDEFYRRQSDKRDYINDHLTVLSGKYDSDTHILHVTAQLDEEIRKLYKMLATSPIVEKVKELSRLCDTTNCDECPYSTGLFCKLRNCNEFPYNWKELLD